LTDVTTPPKAQLVQDLALVAATSGSAPVVLFTDGEDVRQILEALDAGVRGVVPTTLSLKVAIQALLLVKAGGTFVPTNALCGLRDVADAADLKPSSGIFTARQMAVMDRIVQGKANKIIAYELAMCESTVKVHVRSIMRKLQASNRTQAVYLYQSMMAA
jgi:DNA-binding NarL/FixJ family response regulator